MHKVSRVTAIVDLRRSRPQSNSGRKWFLSSSYCVRR